MLVLSLARSVGPAGAWHRAAVGSLGWCLANKHDKLALQMGSPCLCVLGVQLEAQFARSTLVATALKIWLVQFWSALPPKFHYTLFHGVVAGALTAFPCPCGCAWCDPACCRLGQSFSVKEAGVLVMQFRLDWKQPPTAVSAVGEQMHLFELSQRWSSYVPRGRSSRLHASLSLRSCVPRQMFLPPLVTWSYHLPCALCVQSILPTHKWILSFWTRYR